MMLYFRKQPPQSLPPRVSNTTISHHENSILWNSQNRIVTVGTGTSMSTGARMWFSSAALRNVECTVPRTRMHLLIAQHQSIHLNAYLHTSSHSFPFSQFQCHFPALSMGVFPSLYFLPRLLQPSRQHYFYASCFFLLK